MVSPELLAPTGAAARQCNMQARAPTTPTIIAPMADDSNPHRSMRIHPTGQEQEQEQEQEQRQSNIWNPAQTMQRNNAVAATQGPMHLTPLWSTYLT